MYSLATFYQSKAWVNLLKIIKDERTNEQGFIICEQCGAPIVNKFDCIGHHKEELTELNVNNLDISLNPANVSLVHHRCHNKIHERFCSYIKKVYIVYGAPCSGKSSFVNEAANKDDLILDIDKIYEMVSNNPRYIKPNRLKQNVFTIRDCILDQIKTRKGQWRNAYVIGGYPLMMDRERLATLLGAEVIFIDTPKDECLARAKDRPGEWPQYIEDYFDKLQ